jgi:hypothetical protein
MSPLRLLLQLRHVATCRPSHLALPTGLGLAATQVHLLAAPVRLPARHQPRELGTASLAQQAAQRSGYRAVLGVLAVRDVEAGAAVV